MSRAETPIPSQHCPRQNGYFGHEKKNICDQFYYCVDGMYNMITCPQGLVFNPKTGICTWPDEAHKAGCSSEGKVLNIRFEPYVNRIFCSVQMYFHSRAQRWTNRMRWHIHGIRIRMIVNFSMYASTGMCHAEMDANWDKLLTIRLNDANGHEKFPIGMKTYMIN